MIAGAVPTVRVKAWVAAEMLLVAVSVTGELPAAAPAGTSSVAVP